MEDFEYQNIRKLTTDFKQMIASGKSIYFDSEEMELVIDQLLYDFEFDFLEKAINHAIKTYPHNSYFRIQRVKQLIFELKLEDAEKELNSIEENFPPSPEFYLEKVLFMRMIGSGQDTFDLLKKAILLDPENPEVHFFLAYEHITRDNMTKALKHLFFALRTDETFEEQLYNFSYYFEESKQYSQSFDFFKILSDEFPLLKGVWFGLGLATSLLGDQQQAIAYYELALSLDEEMSTAHFNIANSYFEMSNFDMAIDHYHKTLAIDNLDINAYTGIADAYVELGEFDLAMEYYNKSIDINPSHTDAIFGMMTVLDFLGRHSELSILAEKIFTLSTAYPGLLFEILEEYEQEQKYEKMITLLRTAEHGTEDKVSFFNHLVHFCCNNNLTSEAINILSDYQDMKELELMIDYYYAALHYLNFNISKGQFFLEKALIINYPAFSVFLTFSQKLESFPSVINLIDRYRL